MKGVRTMPLTMLPLGSEAVINACGVKDDTGKFLQGLGIIPGASISVVSEMSGNLIISIKGSRIAINKGIAQQVMVEA